MREAELVQDASYLSPAHWGIDLAPRSNKMSRVYKSRGSRTIRLYVASDERGGKMMVCKTYRNEKVAMSAFANKMLDRSHPTCVQLTVDGREVARTGEAWY